MRLKRRHRMLETLPLAELYGVAARRPFLCSSPSGHELGDPRLVDGVSLAVVFAFLRLPWVLYCLAGRSYML